MKQEGIGFAAYAHQVHSKSEADALVDQIKEQSKDCAHCGFAYILGTTHQEHLCSDGGDVGGSVGLPILNFLKAKKMTNTIIIVTRDHCPAGTCPGRKVLATGYLSAAKQVVAIAGVEEVIEYEEVTLSFDYSDYNRVLLTIKEFEGTIATIQHEVRCTAKVAVKKTARQALLKKLVDLTDGELAYEEPGSTMDWAMAYPYPILTRKIPK